jgi:hypothetical protein
MLGGVPFEVKARETMTENDTGSSTNSELDLERQQECYREFTFVGQPMSDAGSNLMAAESRLGYRFDREEDPR